MSDTSLQTATPAHYTSAPAIFCDGVSSAAVGVGVVKFYIVRIDPSVDGDGETASAVAAQIIMPLDGFISTALFFQERLQHYVKIGVLSQEQVNEKASFVNSKS